MIAINIGIVGPIDSVKQATSVTKSFSNVEVIPLVYSEHDEVIPMINKHLHHLDGIFFTGVLPFRLAVREINFTIPIDYLEHDISTILRSLFIISNEHQLELTKFSVDLFKLEDVKEFFEEIGLPFKDIYVIEGRDIDNVPDLTQFHIDLYKKKKINFCLTSSLNTLEELRKLNIPAFRVVSTKYALRKSLEILLLEIESNQTEKTQISVGIFSIDNLQGVSKNYSEYDLQKIKLEVYQHIIEYGRITQSSVVFTGGEEFIVYSTKGKILSEKARVEATVLLKRIHEFEPVTVSYGIGGGSSANEATNYARIALRKAIESGGNCAFVKKVDGTLIGPIHSKNELQFVTGLEERAKEISDELGISVATISKIMAIIERNGKDVLSANELAELYGCSIRSARRLLSSLEKNGYAKIHYFDQLYEVGRPRRYYKINFNS